MSDNKENTKWFIVIFMIIVFIIGISTDLPGLSGAAVFFILAALFLD